LRWLILRTSRSWNNSWDFVLTFLLFMFLFSVYCNPLCLGKVYDFQILYSLTQYKAHFFPTETGYLVKRKNKCNTYGIQRLFGLNPSLNLYLSWFRFTIFWWECFLKRLTEQLYTGNHIKAKYTFNFSMNQIIKFLFTVLLILRNYPNCMKVLESLFNQEKILNIVFPN